MARWLNVVACRGVLARCDPGGRNIIWRAVSGTGGSQPQGSKRLLGITLVRFGTHAVVTIVPSSWLLWMFHEAGPSLHRSFGLKNRVNVSPRTSCDDHEKSSWLAP